MIQNGVVVLRPRRLAFLMMGEAMSWGSFAGRAAMAGAGFVRVGGAPRSGSAAERAAIESVAAHLGRLPPHAVDAEVPAWVSQHGGRFLDPTTAALRHVKELFGHDIHFDTGRQRVHVGFASRALQHPSFQRLLAGWR